ncbi:Uncharacterised protein [Niallia circulans]|uniref:hypothetical protein n=1 Tax=Shouchella TaxID=2893057 RepID=UPI000787F143|nr:MULTISPECIES: hypothetical protein [Shouchella]PAD91230.1 hypothetical protein CHH52_15375 [Shouchella clausii]GIN13946.1 hypothetical protein J26TS2_38130 [Shouchella clausii]SPT77380.1 Uncharacterised protein [Niallia circulans]
MASKKWGILIAGVVIGAVLVKKDWRNRVCQEAKELKQQAGETYAFLRDNRENMVGQAKEVMEDVRSIWKDISEDVRTLTQTASHMKETSEEAIQAAKEAADEIKLLKKQREMNNER